MTSSFVVLDRYKISPLRTMYVQLYVYRMRQTGVQVTRAPHLTKNPPHRADT